MECSKSSGYASGVLSAAAQTKRYGCAGEQEEHDAQSWCVMRRPMHQKEAASKEAVLQNIHNYLI
jgi:hypothetical protein